MSDPFELEQEQELYQPGELKPLDTGRHYELAMQRLSEAEAMGLGTALELTLSALAHTMLGGLASELEYRAEQKRRELAEAKKSRYGASEEGGVRIEEDDDVRP